MASVQRFWLFNPKLQLIWKSKADRYKLHQRQQKLSLKPKKILLTSSDLLLDLYQTKTQAWAWNAQHIIHPMLTCQKCRLVNRWVKGWICKLIQTGMQSFQGQEGSLCMNWHKLFHTFFKSVLAQCIKRECLGSPSCTFISEGSYEHSRRAQSRPTIVCIESMCTV